jgi:hypothetical protein
MYDSLKPVLLTGKMQVRIPCGFILSILVM